MQNNFLSQNFSVQNILFLTKAQVFLKLCSYFKHWKMKSLLFVMTCGKQRKCSAMHFGIFDIAVEMLAVVSQWSI